MQLIVLGRQPELSLAELEAVFGAAAVKYLGQDVAKLTGPADISRLGGAIKIAEVIAEFDSPEPNDLADQLAKLLPAQNGKYNFGLSWHGSRSGQANRLALNVKKILKRQGHKLRVVPSQDPALSSAKVWHNRLDKPPNSELILARRGSKLVVAKTTQTQDIAAYAKRDHGRPARDARVGMLPPKLAQIMVNLTGLSRGRILDPFVGTGVVLQEAGLLGFSLYGSDITARMVDYTRQNLDHLGLTADLQTADARHHKWQPPIDGIVSETYLGPPLVGLPDPSEVGRLEAEASQLVSEFLVNIAVQIPAGTPLVLAVPAWQTKSGSIVRLTAVDQIERLGYTRRSFKTVESQDLIYRRPDQVVGRQLLVLTRS